MILEAEEEHLHLRMDNQSSSALSEVHAPLEGQELLGTQTPNLCSTTRSALINELPSQVTSPRHSINPDSCMSNWVIPATSSRAVTAKPLLVLQEKKEKASLGSNGSFKAHCSTQPVLLLQLQGGIALLLAPCLPCWDTGEPTVPAWRSLLLTFQVKPPPEGRFL